MERIFLKSLPIDWLTPDQIMERITRWLDQADRFHQIITLNASMVIMAQTNSVLTGVIQRADLVTIDGYGIAAALQRRGQIAPPRLPGVALTQKVLDWCANQPRRVYFYGGTSQTAAKLQAVIDLRWPGLRVSSIQNGFTTGDIRQDIIDRQPDLLLVGLGTPTQEILIASLADYLTHTVAIGVGGSFEIIAGLKGEAPLIIRRCGLEWAYRMMQDPRRINRIPQLIEFWYHYLR